MLWLYREPLLVLQRRLEGALERGRRHRLVTVGVVLRLMILRGPLLVVESRLRPLLVRLGWLLRRCQRVRRLWAMHMLYLLQILMGTLTGRHG